MKTGFTLAVIFACLATALYADRCLEPVAYETPRSEIELSQPHRLASETLIYPGYPWLVISLTNRYPLHTVRGNRLEELRADWPQAGLWQYRNSAVRPDGTVLGFGRRPNRVFTLSPGESVFRAAALPEYRHATYEPHRDVVLMLTESGALLEWDGAQVQPSHLTGIGVGPNVVLPRYIEEFDLWLALVDGTMMARRAGQEHDWEAMGGEVGKWWGHLLADTDYFASRDKNILSFVLGGRLYIYEVPESGPPRLKLQEDGQFWLLPSTGKTGLVQKTHPAVRRSGFAKLLGQRDQDTWKEPLIVTPEGLKSAALLPVSQHPTPGAVRTQDRSRDVMRHNSLGYTPPFIELPDGLYFLDGTHRVPVPHLSEQSIGRFVRWFQWNDRFWALTEQGWHEFNPDLTLSAVPSPLDAIGSVSHVDITQSDRLGGLVFTARTGASRGAMWITRDGRAFEEVLPAGSDAYRYVSDIPNRADGLVLGGKGLYLLKNTCNGD